MGLQGILWFGRPLGIGKRYGMAKVGLGFICVYVVVGELWLIIERSEFDG